MNLEKEIIKLKQEIKLIKEDLNLLFEKVFPKLKICKECRQHLNCIEGYYALGFNLFLCNKCIEKNILI